MRKRRKSKLILKQNKDKKNDYKININNKMVNKNKYRKHKKSKNEKIIWHF
jgi:hypothetical protein